MSLEFTAHLLLPAMGFLLALILAFRSFNRRSIQLGDEPTLPEYFSRRGMYLLGVATYSLIVAGLFYALLRYWLPLTPFFETVANHKGDLPGLFATLDGPKILPFIVAPIYLLAIAWDARINPLTILRDTVFDVFAISRRAVDVYNVLRGSRLSEIDQEMRQQVVAHLLVDTLNIGDFDKARESVEYRWARACVLYHQIQSYTNEESYHRFFTEPSLKWGDIALLFNESSEKVAVWKREPPPYTKTMELIGTLDSLDRLLCRLLACIVIFGSQNEKSMWSTVVRLGGNPNRLRLKHTWKYVLTYAAAIVIGIVVGREFSIFLHGQISDAPGLRFFSIDTWRWILYGLFIYLLPITLVFMARVFADRPATEAENRYFGFYIAMIVMGYLISTTVSALVLGLADTFGTSDTFDFLESFKLSMRWGILPALLCGYVAYRMDMPASETEPKRRMYLLALGRFAIGAIVGLVVSLYATDGLGPQAAVLQFTVVITTMVLIGALAAVTRFKTIATGA